jgi:hypothetical protein
MKKEFTAKVDGKECNISYERNGNRIEITVQNQELHSAIPPGFPCFIVNGIPKYIIGHPDTKRIADQIVKQILLNEQSN